MGPAEEAARARATAFGLDLHSSFELPGVHDDVPRTGRALRLVARTGAEPDVVPGERIVELADPSGTPLMTVDGLGSGGFRVWGAGFGEARVGADGREIACAPADTPAWRWQRLLTGQVLPLAALLQGLEVFHASAVVEGGRAFAVVAPSGGGKTSLALELVLRGARLLNDDVLVLEPHAEHGLVAHPGPGLANVPRDGGGLWERLLEAGAGRELGGGADEVRAAVARHTQPVPLGGLFFLRRGGAGTSAAIKRLDPLDPRLLLAATFNLALRGPERLARQLDVCGRLAESCPVFLIDCPAHVDAKELAADLHAHAAALEGVVS